MTTDTTTGGGTRLQLSLSGKGLKNVSGLFETSDPFAVVMSRGTHPKNPPILLGRTDVVFNNLNPQWSTILFLEGYKFGVPYYIEVGVFDFDAHAAGTTERKLQLNDAHTNVNIVGFADAANHHNHKNKNRHTSTKGKGSPASAFSTSSSNPMIGTAVFEVGDIIGCRGNVRNKALQKGRGTVGAHIERCRVNDAEALRGVTLGFQLRAYQLKNTQGFGKTSSPFFEIFRRTEHPTGATWIKVYQSNVVRKDLQPIWNESTLDVEAICNGNLERAMKVVIWDHRRSGKHKHMGEFETTVQGLLEAAQHGDPTKSTTVQDVLVGFTVTKQENGKHKAAGRCEVIKAVISGRSRRNNRPEGYQRKLIPSSTSSLSSSSSLHSHQQYMNMRKQPSSDSASSTTRLTTALSVSTPPKPTLIDYITGGCQISLAVAIDFTASNGDPSVPGTPHYFQKGGDGGSSSSRPHASNDYEKAIYAVGSILANYDSDKQFPVWGFGAKYDGKVRHCFQCGDEVEVDGVQGMLEAYRSVFATPLKMSFPTKFNDVIHMASEYATRDEEENDDDTMLSYTILLILTAGNVQDVMETKKELLEASTGPLSVVIIGIGDADFSGMEFLDSFDDEKATPTTGQPLSARGRDITKFVKFNDYTTANALTEAVLDEIPDQLVNYFYSKGRMPGGRPVANGDDEHTGIPGSYHDDDVEVQPADDEDDDDEREFSFS